MYWSVFLKTDSEADIFCIFPLFSTKKKIIFLYVFIPHSLSDKKVFLMPLARHTARVENSGEKRQQYVLIHCPSILFAVSQGFSPSRHVLQYVSKCFDLHFFHMLLL